jgi:hypothetical protein
MMLNRDDTPWHTTGLPGEGPETLRVSLYLDSTEAPHGGALQVVPGSHLPEYNRLLFEQFGRFDGGATRLDLPASGAPGAATVATQPGDIAVWYTRLWHAAYRRPDRQARRAIFLTYIADPAGDGLRAEKLRRLVAAIVGPEQRALYSEALLDHGGAAVRAMARRLAELGVTDVVSQSMREAS